MGDADVEISVIAADGILFVSVRVPLSASRDVVEARMLKVTEAFASVERIDGKLLQELLWERKPHDDRIQLFVLSREYENLDYPRLFDCALRDLTVAAANNYLH